MAVCPKVSRMFVGRLCTGSAKDKHLLSYRPWQLCFAPCLNRMLSYLKLPSIPSCMP
jgi:hypothetical protein